MSQQQSVKYTTKSLLEQICLDLLLPLFTLREKRVSSNYPTLWKVWSRSLADSGLNRTRRQITPILPTSQDFDIPLFYQQTTEGKRFLLADRVQRADGEIVKRMIVFATNEQLRLLCSCSHIMMDGTFDSSPPNFEQIYSIHGIKNDQSRIAWSPSPSPLCKMVLIRFRLCSCSSQWPVYQDLQRSIFGPFSTCRSFEPWISSSANYLRLRSRFDQGSCRWSKFI